jgi:hypothetical protein
LDKHPDAERLLIVAYVAAKRSGLGATPPSR